MAMERIVIAAVAENLLIGKENDLAWHLPADMKYFKATTKGYPVIMGRKNYESIPERFRPLPGRLNIVLSRQQDYPLADGVELCSDLQEALEIAQATGKDKAFIIGGGEIYKEALDRDLADKLLITWVDAELEGDAFFPDFDKEMWSSQTLMHLPADESHAHAMRFMEYTKA
jgi:dihydrofolate reductase